MKNNRTDWIPTTDPMDWIKRYGVSESHPALSSDEEHDPAYKQLTLLRQQLFVNQGWRLTKRGLTLLTGKYTHYTSTHEDNKIMTGRVLLNMDKAVLGPWAWGWKDSTIIVFDAGIHFELQICNGSAQQFINFKN